MTVPSRLREHLAASRRRGVPWERAWPHALDAVLCLATDRHERGTWWHVLTDMEAVWRAGHHRQAVFGCALSVIVESPEGLDEPGVSGVRRTGPRLEGLVE